MFHFISNFFSPSSTDVAIELEYWCFKKSRISHHCMDFKPCYKNSDFEKVYQDIANIMTSEQNGKYTLQITLQGTLNNKKIDLMFNNLNFFRSFLERRKLINEGITPPCNAH